MHTSTLYRGEWRTFGILLFCLVCLRINFYDCTPPAMRPHVIVQNYVIAVYWLDAVAVASGNLPLGRRKYICSGEVPPPIFFLK